jgi:hypothetical protein
MNRHILSLILAACILCGLSPSLSAQLTEAEQAERPAMEEFMRGAAVIEWDRPLNPRLAVTNPYRLLLDKDGIRRHGWWKNVEGRPKGFKDYWRCEVAAYELDKLLGLNMVPPVVEKRFQQFRGALSLEMEGSVFRELEERGEHRPPPRFRYSWNRTLYVRRTWDNLLGNPDRNAGDMIVTEDWRVYLIDHSRAFPTSDRLVLRPNRKYTDGEPVKALPEQFVRKLERLDYDTVKKAVGDYLTNGEVEALLKRRDKMMKEFERLKKKYPNFLY